MATEDGGLDGQVWGFAITVVATPDPGQVCVRLTGELDIATAPVARDRIADLEDEGRDLVLDLRGLSFIDSSGLNLLLELAAQSTRDGWNLSLIPGASVVQRIFQLTDTEERLPFKSHPADGRPPEPVA
jgi:anti-sigma B factor antagonist